MEKEVSPGKEKHAISLYVCNHAGVLARIALIFTKRGYNIDSLVVSHGQDPNFSWMNIEASGSSETFNLMLKQLNKLIDVIQVKGYAGNTIDNTKIERELAMIKFSCRADQRSEVLDLLEVFRGSVIDISQETVSYQVTGKSEKVDAVVGLLSPYGVLEVVRSGKILMERGTAKEPVPLNALNFKAAHALAVAGWEQKAIQE